MSVNVKALRALLAKAVANGMKLPVSESKDVTEREDSSENGLIVAAVNALPDLLALAEAVRELAGPIAMLADPDAAITVGGKFSATALDDEERDAARRVLAILDPNPTNEGDGR